MSQTPEKIGLALSGGGFRAAFFHIGVLACMADRGLLKSLDVISTVSGGSILGTVYYLHVRNLLERLPDDQITDADYQDIVQALSKEFFEGVSQNIRMRTFSNAARILQMMRPDYSRTDRMGQLLDHYFLKPVFARGRADPLERPLRIDDLRVEPADTREFRPGRDNPSRTNRLPVLLINATSLNTGRSWRFQYRRMGEPFALRDKLHGGTGTRQLEEIVAGEDAPRWWDVDKKPRIQPASNHNQARDRLEEFPLGKAVASSAGVPAVFPPLAINELYHGDIRIELVDGGVYDNQGIDALEHAGCTRILVSDASGQLTADPMPGTSPLSVLGRTNSLLMERIRDYQLTHSMEHHGDRLSLMHLRKGLGVPVWRLRGAHHPDLDEQVAEDHTHHFQVDPRVGDLLSKIRTDLDCFTEVEAAALMAYGYQQASYFLPELPDVPAAERLRPWWFLEISEHLERPSDELLRQLTVAQYTTFKVFCPGPHRSVTILAWAWLFAFVAFWGWATSELAGLLAGAVDWVIELFFGAGVLLEQAVYAGAFIGVLLSCAILIVGPAIIAYSARELHASDEESHLKKTRFARVLQTLNEIFLGGVLPLIFIWIPFNLHRWCMDPLYLWQGRLSQLPPPPDPQPKQPPRGEPAVVGEAAEELD